MKFTVIQQVTCQKRNFGHRDKVAAGLRRTRAGSRLSKMLKSGGSDSPTEASENNESNNQNQSDQGSNKKEQARSNTKQEFGAKPKPYGQHDGNTHVHQLVHKDLDSIEAVEELVRKLDAVNQMIESQPSINVSDMKRKVLDADAKTVQNYRIKYGTELSGDVGRQQESELASHAVEYYVFQSTILIACKEEFEGAEFNETHKLWIMAGTCKAMYANNMITMEFVQRLAGIASGKEDYNSTVLTSVTYVLQQSKDGRLRYRPNYPDRDNSTNVLSNTGFDRRRYKDVLDELD